MVVIDWVFGHQQQVGVVFATICVLWCVVLHLIAKKPIGEKTVGPLIAGAFAAYAIPQGFLLFYCCFDKTKLEKIEDLPLYLGVASLSAIILSVIAAANAIKASRK